MNKVTFKQKRFNRNWIIALIAISPLFVSVISAFHIMSWFYVADSFLMSSILAGAYEFLVIVSILAIALLDNIDEKAEKQLWLAIYALLVLQILGNVYFYFVNIKQEFLIQVANLFGMSADIGTRRLLAILLGSILPLTSFFFTKFLAGLIRRRREPSDKV